ncbi:hypothetical protein B0T25DRAFT_554633 [Lasiosphaeria hispida]|uniref:Uncharacterized protein n=1 Tax=Lasiosphaeria hispida TaxID=260671 RepID=A0AAJ0H849_9PEZI|nr:hypothetical protein B0T25DRAFT_554633 [Lasiosphaeria hispida]
MQMKILIGRSYPIFPLPLFCFALSVVDMPGEGTSLRREGGSQGPDSKRVKTSICLPTAVSQANRPGLPMLCPASKPVFD